MYDELLFQDGKPLNLDEGDHTMLIPGGSLFFLRTVQNSRYILCVQEVVTHFIQYAYNTKRVTTSWTHSTYISNFYNYTIFSGFFFIIQKPYEMFFCMLASDSKIQNRTKKSYIIQNICSIFLEQFLSLQFAAPTLSVTLQPCFRSSLNKGKKDILF